MNSNKRYSRRKKPRGNSVRRASNILVFKLVDPICQSLLFILFIYCLDSDTDTQYQTILELIVGWQILSSITNFILNPPELLKVERIAFFVSMIAYIFLAFFIEKHVTEKFITIQQANNVTIPLYDSILEAGAMIISFWYYVICFREIREMLTSSTNEAS